MGYDVSQILTPGAVQCGLVTGFLYMLPLQKRMHFPQRVIVSVVISLLLAPLLKSYQTFSVGLFLRTNAFPTLLATVIGTGVTLLLNLLLLFVTVFFCCKLKWYKALYCAVCAYLTQDIAYTVFVVLMPNAANRGVHPVQPDTLWLEFLIMLLVYSFFFVFFARKLPENGDYHFQCSHSLPAMLVLIFIGRILGTCAKWEYDLQNNRTFVLMLIYDALLSTTLLVTQLLQRKEESYRTAAALESQLRLMQKLHYEAFRSNLDAINHKCHDLKLLVAALQNESDSNRKKELLSELEQDVMIYDAHMDTGNDALDALLSDAWMNCYHKDVQWTCMADGHAVSFIDSIDLYTMLGNALENAIESASQVENPQKRFLSVNIWRKERMAFLKIENYCETEPHFQNGLPVTTKNNNSFDHGYGMRSIRSVVRRYDGELKISTNNHVFTLSVLLPIPMDFYSSTESID